MPNWRDVPNGREQCGEMSIKNQSNLLSVHYTTFRDTFDTSFSPCEIMKQHRRPASFVAATIMSRHDNLRESIYSPIITTSLTD